VATARDLIRRAAAAIVPPRACPCAEAARFALMTDRASLSPEARHRLELIVGRYL
jgi:5'-methylthioadenosine phosphorylase